MAVEHRIRSLIEPSIEEMGFDLVRVRYSGAKRPTLQIMADRKDETPISVTDCANISRAVSAIMDVDDPITEAYALEVSSPGIDRPLVRPRDYERFAGFEAKFETTRLIDGQKRYRGTIIGITDGVVEVEQTEGGRVRLTIDEIATAKLLLTDALIAWAEAQQAEHAPYDDEDIEFEEGDDGTFFDEDDDPDGENDENNENDETRDVEDPAVGRA